MLFIKSISITVFRTNKDRFFASIKCKYRNYFFENDNERG